VMLLLIYPLSVSAETYQWTDERGTENFTEDLGKVPKKYRKKVKVLGGAESGAPQIIETTEPVKGKAKESGGQKEKKAPTAREEANLRGDYAVAKANLHGSEQDIIDLKARLADTSKMSRTEFLTIQNSIKQNEARLQELKKRLDQAREKAEKAGITLEGK
jgi:acetyl-CoA carboxylase alpha subunit